MRWHSVVIDGRYLTDHYPGIGRYVYNLVKALTETASTTPIHLLVDGRAPQTRFDLGRLERQGLRVVPLGTSPRSLRGWAGVRHQCRQASPALFHATHLFLPPGLSCPSLLTVYDVIPMHDTSYLPSTWRRVAYRALLRQALGTAAHILTLSEATKHDLTRLCGVPANRITVTPAAADASFQPAGAEEVTALGARLGLPAPYALCVGTNRPHKNLPRLIEAWALVTAGRRDRCQLVIAGAEDHRYPQARQLARALNLDTVRFLGPVAEADLPALYTGARLVVQPASCEGFGLPLVEAMACGTPVACARVPALVEVGGDAVLDFDPRSPDDMAATIRQGLEAGPLRSELVARGQARARRFSWARTAELTLEAYRRIQHDATRGAGRHS